MNLRRLLIAGAAAVFACLAGTTSALAASDDARHLDGIAAVVNDSIVLESELAAEVQRVRGRLQREGQDVPPRPVLRERVLDELILEQIQLQRAARMGISVSDSQVVEALRNMASDRGTDLAGLRERLAGEEGRSFEQLRADVRHQLIVSRLRERAVASQVQVSEQAVEDLMQRVERASERRAELRLRHILVGLPADASTDEVDAARERAEQVVERLEQGANFADLASRISDGPRALEGGDLGWRRRSQLPGLFIDAVDGRAPGSIAGPVRSPNGFHVLKVVDRRGGAEQTVTEHRARHILIRGGSEADQSPRERLAELRERIVGGASFAELARANSADQSSAPEGGDLGWVGPGDMPPAFRQVLDNLEPGQLSEPFRSPLGWHLVQLEDVRERTDVEAFQRAQARQTLYRRQVEEETQRWLRQLRDGAYVEVRIDE